MAKIDKLSFGSIIIDGKKHRKDVLPTSYKRGGLGQAPGREIAKTSM